jgi:DNA-binding phage protein
MVKANVVGGQKLKIKKGAPVTAYSPTQELLDEEFISKSIWACLKNNDPEGVIEVINAHLEIASKVAVCQKMSLARSTLYHSLKAKNPTLKTLAKLVSAVHAELQ